jgi:hypothetical protein
MALFLRIIHSPYQLCLSAMYSFFLPQQNNINRLSAAEHQPNRATYNVDAHNTQAHSTLWTHVRKPYPYKHLRRTGLADLEIHEVTTCFSVSTETSPTTKSIAPLNPREVSQRRTLVFTKHLCVCPIYKAPFRIYIYIYTHTVETFA